MGKKNQQQQQSRQHKQQPTITEEQAYNHSEESSSSSEEGNISYGYESSEEDFGDVAPWPQRARPDQNDPASRKNDPASREDDSACRKKVYQMASPSWLRMLPIANVRTNSIRPGAIDALLRDNGWNPWRLLRLFTNKRMDALTNKIYKYIAGTTIAPTLSRA